MRLTSRARALLWLTVVVLVVFDGRLLLGGSSIAVDVDGRSISVPTGITVEEVLRRLETRPRAGDLLAVDRSVLRPGAFLPIVLVNGRPVASTRHLHAGDRVTVESGRDRLEPAVRIVRRLPPSVPGRPIRSLATGPVREVLLRGKLSGRVALVAFRPAGSMRAPLPVALTFDDGPWPRTTEQVLAILSRMHAPATFFLVGREVERRPELVRSQLAAGMAVGTHSFSHPQAFDRLPISRIRSEVIRGRRALDRLGVRPVGFRPPGGSASQAVVSAADRLGYRTVLWNVDPVDWQPGVTAEQVVQRVLTSVRPGAIVLLHDGGGDRSATVAALPRIIDGLRRLGLTLTVLPS